ncbi:uncharacterized protein [Montipora capricornis]|uniref:uncharacterized protein n=1 Tax=Montipora capricornis TaxID=246305 RepID=UPI0035F132AC
MGYDLDFTHIKGKDLLIADALSRSHVTNQTRSQSEEEIETIRLVIQDQSVTSHLKEILERNNQKETLMSHSIPDRPWSKIGADLFEFKQEHYLVLVDYYSDWIEFDKMRDQTATETIALLLKQFPRRGLPDEIVTDCGKNFYSKEFSQFCQRKQIKHTKSSPHHHQSNGKAESAVKIAKAILRKTENSDTFNPYEALLDQHNTPTVDMTTSPAQRFLHRRLKPEIPMKATLFAPEIAETIL